MEEVSVNAVSVQDAFWAPRLKIFRDNLIPVVWPRLAVPIAMLENAAKPEKPPIKDAGDFRYAEGDVHKILEAASCALVQGPFPELEQRIDALIAKVSAAQQPDGYAYAYAITAQGPGAPWSGQLEDGYATGFLMEGAIAHYRATGKRTYLDIARRAADSAWRHFVEQKNPGFPGHPEIEPALGELYRVTGDGRYLDLLRTLVEARGPISQQGEIAGHAVMAVFFATSVADLGIETGDKSVCEAARRLWNSTSKRKMYVSGGVGSRPSNEAFGGDYELPNRTGYCESCASCGLVNFAHRMLRMDGDAEAADVLELALYNAVLHGVSLDGKTTYSYMTPLSDANHLRSETGICCPTTLYRTLMQVGRYVYGVSGDTLYVNLFVGGSGQVPLKSGRVTVRQETDYPWGGAVLIRIEPEKEAEFALRVRVPGWSRGATFRVNGKPSEPRIEKGYAEFRRSWRKGDEIQLDLPMPVRRVEAHPNVPDDVDKVAVQRGPLVYALESLDNEGRTLVSLPSAPLFRVERRAELLGGISVVRGEDVDRKTFTAIPFYALANRGNSQQEVWVHQSEKRNNNEGWEGKLYREYQP